MRVQEVSALRKHFLCLGSDGARSKANELLGPQAPFANVVLQGGGTLGIAHVGAIVGLELAGIRIAGIAGTSAGAIVALLVAASRTSILQPCGEEVLDILSSMPTPEFIDGNYLTRRLIKDGVAGRLTDPIDLAMPTLAALSALINRNGLNPGIFFEDWLATTLADRYRIATMSQLEKRMDEQRRQLGSSEATSQPMLRMISTALPFGIKFIFPEHARRLTWDPKSTSPAQFARASMSIPLFFEPLVESLNRDEWRDAIGSDPSLVSLPISVKESLSELDAIQLFDGGILSNFPVDSFSDSKFPTIAFGIHSFETMNSESLASNLHGTRGVARQLVGLFSSARLLRDREAISRCLNAGPVMTRVSFIDTGPHNWLDFMLTQADEVDLLRRGLIAAADLLQVEVDT